MLLARGQGFGASKLDSGALILPSDGLIFSGQKSGLAWRVISNANAIDGLAGEALNSRADDLVRRPHNRWPGERDLKAIWPANLAPMRSPDHLGRERNWILEIHLVDRARTFGGFYERLL